MIWLLFMFILSNALTFEGGNITELNASGSVYSNYWIGLLANTTFSSVTSPAGIYFNSSGIYVTNLSLKVTCSNPITPWILFSNSSRISSPLRAGNLSYLQLYINGSEGANNTLLNNATLTLPMMGSIFNVPYVNASGVPTYYLQDRWGNLVFATPVYVPNVISYKGTAVNVQAMLPFLNLTYYIHVYYGCITNPPEDDYWDSDYGGYVPPPKPVPKPTSPPTYRDYTCSLYVTNCTLEGDLLKCKIEGCNVSKNITLLTFKNISINEVSILMDQLPVYEKKKAIFIKHYYTYYIYFIALGWITGLISSIIFLTSLRRDLFINITRIWNTWAQKLKK